MTTIKTGITSANRADSDGQVADAKTTEVSQTQSTPELNVSFWQKMKALVHLGEGHASETPARRSDSQGTRQSFQNPSSTPETRSFSGDSSSTDQKNAGSAGHGSEVP